MEQLNKKNKNSLAYRIGWLIGLMIFVMLGLCTLLLIGGLGFKLLQWIFGI